MKGKIRAFMGIALSTLLVVLLAVLISSRGWLAPPASAQNDLLGQLFGGARQAVGGNVMERADQYYHGGVGHRNCQTSHNGENEGQEGHKTQQADDGKIHLDEDTPREASAGGGWWARLNEALTPRGHVHLHGERQTRELLPWMWAAVKADPENIEATATTAYWLSSQLDKPEQAIDVLDDALRHNPDSHELLLAKARIIRDRRQDLETAARLFRKALESWKDSHSLPPSNLDAARSYYALCMQRAMALIALERNNEAVTLLEKALPYSPNPDAIRQRIRELQNKTPKRNTREIPEQSSAIKPNSN